MHNWLTNSKIIWWIARGNTRESPDAYSVGGLKPFINGFCISHVAPIVCMVYTVQLTPIPTTWLAGFVVSLYNVNQHLATAWTMYNVNAIKATYK